MFKLIYIPVWFLLTMSLFIGIGYYSYNRIHNPPIISLEHAPQVTADQTINATDLMLSDVKGISTDIRTGDARPIILAGFLEKHNSPLKPYDYWGEFLTDLADKYDLDYRLLPSISMQESNLCKKIPHGTHNCLGLGIHSQGTWGFDRYEDNFEAAAKILRRNYIDKGYVTPDEIQDKYTPGSNGSWEFAVNHFMKILENADY